MSQDKTRRLPGIRVEAAEPPLRTELPRLDIAAFVGFAERLPPDQPVILESPDTFPTAFGGDVALAWEEAAGCVVNGQLGAAVRAFFAQGGRRCYVLGLAPPGPNRELDLGVFLDRELAGVSPEALVAVANDLQFGSPVPRSLDGIHALLSVEEPSLIAVPDAVLAGWSLEPVVKAVALPPAPVLAVQAQSRVAVSLSWTAVPDADRYVVEEASEITFARSVEVKNTPATSLRLEAARNETPRRRFWRVRAFAGGLSSVWSNVVFESLPAEVFGRCGGDLPPSPATPEIAPATSAATPSDLPRLKRPEEFTDADHAALLAVHRALLRLCRARGDLFAILSLPAHADATFAEKHLAALQPDSKSPLALARTFDVPPLSGAEAETPSFGALYHPWLASASAAGTLAAAPPDGTVCGLIARRTLARGAWIAPANERLPGVVALQPVFTQAARQQLRDLQVNEVRLTADGIRCLAADTLCQQPELRAINVRRLLMLLRRLAEREGAALVFEPHGDVLRRWVQRTFEDLLERLFRLGAFAGRTRAESFQVVTDASLNPPASVDAGRFVVELRVAPSQPLEFLTVRLVGDQGRLEVT
jgi:hypothetical protein